MKQVEEKKTKIYDKAADRQHTSFEPFSATTAKERLSVSSVTVSDVAEIILNK